MYANGEASLNAKESAKTAEWYKRVKVEIEELEAQWAELAHKEEELKKELEEKLSKIKSN